MTTQAVVTDTSTKDWTPTRRGKVRDIYDLGDELLIVATDRISAFDVILPDGIPDKGKVLTQISHFWFNKLSHIVPHHILSVDVKDFPKPFSSAPEIFSGRSMLVRKTNPLPVECVVRGYLSGSGWKDYQKTQSISGIRIEKGLKESDKLPNPLFTPSTKAELGEHDETISLSAVEAKVGSKIAGQLEDISLRLYEEGAAFAETKGIIIADTKFEFGLSDEGNIVWIDEALTPDSSRFWPMSRYRPGGAQPSFDKQFVRDHLLSVQWSKTPPAPKLPVEVIETTRKKYVEALRLLTGKGIQ